MNDHLHPGLSKRRSRRLMKKMHLGQFQEMGFHVAIEIEPGQNDEFLIDAMLMEVIEPMGLGYGGWLDGFVARMAGSANEENRARLGDWLRARREVRSVKIGPLEDAWYTRS